MESRSSSELVSGQGQGEEVLIEEGDGVLEKWTLR